MLIASKSVVRATPYATCLTNSGTSISFRLNEAADNVKIISSAGAVTNELGPVVKGLTVTNLSIVGVYKIEVSKTAGAGYLLGVVNQISDDTANTVKFANQRGVAINKNTNSPYFGRIYVSVGASGTANGRTVSDGIYILNADQSDAVGQGDLPRTGGLNGGLGFDRFAASAESPNRLIVGPDDNIYITDWSDPNGGLYVTDANVATNAAATNVLAFLGGPSTTTNNHGSISGVWTEGSLGTGDLVVYTQDEDLAPKNGVWQYNIGAGPLAYTAMPTLAFTFGLGAQYADIVRGPDGKWYGANRRAEFATSAGVFAISADGTTPLWNSLSAYRTWVGDPSIRDIYFGETRGIDVSRDGKYLIAFRGATNQSGATITPPLVGANTVLIVPLEDGVPNITNLIAMATPNGTSIGRDIAFDAVGNIYTVSSGQGLLRVYSPGGFSAVTSGSDGSLNVLAPSTKVKIETDTNVVYEAGATVATFTLTRTNDQADFSLPLNITISAGGSATRGTDYVLKTNGVTLVNNSVTFPAGAQTVTVTLNCTDDSTAELNETATVGVTSSTGYVAGSPAQVSVDIVDNETPAVDIVAIGPVAFEGNTNDFVQFQLVRRGDTNNNGISLTVNLNYTGDAVSNVDYIAVPTVIIDPGVVNMAFNVNPIDDLILETNETFTVTVAAGTGYTVGTTTPSATGTIIEDETPAAPVLFSDNLNGDSSTTWTIRTAAGNGIDDYRINEQPLTFPNTAYDYSSENPPIPPAPHGADTLGLRVSVNKDEGSAAGAAGINLYRNDQTFSGNYALRFDMFLMVNSGAGTTENAIFGINHSGNNTNWFRASGNGYTNSSYDGIWFVVGADGAGLGQFNGNAGSGDFEMLGGGAPVVVGGINGPATLASAFSSAFNGTFKSPPWSFVGVPSNLPGSITPSWDQVEIDQIGNVITLKINNTRILSYTNAAGSQSGKIMLGYDDAFDSNTGVGGAAIYDNVRVVNLGRPNITASAHTGTTTTLNFNWTLDDATTAFTIQKASVVTGPYTAATGTLVKLSPGVYRATLTGESASAAYYRIQR